MANDIDASILAPPDTFRVPKFSRRSPEQIEPDFRHNFTLQTLRGRQEKRHFTPPASPRTIARSSPSPSPSMSTSESSSTASSPTLSGASFSQISPPAFALPAKRKSNARSHSMSPIPEDAPIHLNDSAGTSAATLDDIQQYDANQDVKSTLTQLLNCDAVKMDPTMRQWVQTRLMEIEMELKRQRRRRVSTPSIVLSPSEDENGL